MEKLESVSSTDVVLSAKTVVEALYEELLQRRADTVGLEKKIQGLNSKTTTIINIIHEMIASEEFIEKIPSFLNGIDNRRFRFTNDVSENGEIWQLVRLWVNAQAHCGIVVDVGARGRERSNSFDLMKHFGWRGLLIEANPNLLPAIAKDFSCCDMQLVSCAISDYDGKSKLNLGVNEDVSSLSASSTSQWGDSSGSIEVDVRRLADVMKECDIPLEFDLLSLDIEGEDFKVLNDIVENSAFRPRWIIIEAASTPELQLMVDHRFSKEVRRNYTAKAATKSNVILGRQRVAHEDWARRCGEKHHGYNIV